MTGIADFYLYLKRPYSKDRRKRFLAHFFGSHNSNEPTRFVVLSWKRTGSNLLCGILHNHQEILMHNELFNPIDIFTYHPSALKSKSMTKPRWTVLTRDLFPGDFLDFIWRGESVDGEPLHPAPKAIGFKSFPDHWLDVRNEPVWREHLLEDMRVKKIVLFREDELAVFVSMKRADLTGMYLTHSYPTHQKIYIDPAEFQTFLNNYRNTFRKKYRSPVEQRDTFRITYDQLTNEETTVIPKIWEFLGVRDDIPKKLRETVKQADPEEDLANVIENYDELEFCFRHSDVLHFAKRASTLNRVTVNASAATNKNEDVGMALLQSWSLLLPICSRPRTSQALAPHSRTTAADNSQFNANRFIDLALSSQHDDSQLDQAATYWELLEGFCLSLKNTVISEQLKLMECVVGIDVDDKVFNTDEAKERIRSLLPVTVSFISIKPSLYGQLCKIWNVLAKAARNDFVVLLGDDVRLRDHNWPERIVQKFYEIADREKLPFGAACVAMNDLCFPGFPTFPVLHRWHLDHFGSLLPKQFANQGGDPYLYELYSRFNAAAFEVTCSLENTIGGDGDARYEKYHINWRGQILSLNLRHLKQHLGNRKPTGVTLDIVVPSYRLNNNEYLQKIALLRASTTVYVKFWFILDNPDPNHTAEVKKMADILNKEQLAKDSNYFINVLHYGANRGASYARNTGYNYTTADWVLFLDDDIIPDENLLDAYIGAIRRYPDAKVFVGLTELPEPSSTWTEMLRTCNVGYFYSIAKRMVHPSWGVTANLMVRGSRHNSTIQFKGIYPKTGGGEDIDLVYQFKEWYAYLGRRVTVGIPEAKVRHPWWNGGKPCYRQITGWAWGDSLCITEWGRKTFMTCPNWIEHIAFIALPLSAVHAQPLAGIASATLIATSEHLWKGWRYFSEARKVVTKGGLLHSFWVALGAGSVLSAQEVTRTVAAVRRLSLYSLCRRVDWFDGEEPTIKLDIQLGSIVRFGWHSLLTWGAFRVFCRKA